MRLLYNIAIYLYNGIIIVASPFNRKAARWITGRRGWKRDLKEKVKNHNRIIWFHCSSLGEFEQGRPVIEMIREKYSDCSILLTFFSPSGYEIRKNSPLADIVSYLPSDRPGNARAFLDIVQPEAVFFVKYEFWSNFITGVSRRSVPLYLISAIFRPEQYFFRWYGGFFRSILGKFTHVFVQDERSFELLAGIGISRVTITGDTRFDRVSAIASAAKNLPLIEAFSNGERVLIAGSSWSREEEILTGYINDHPDSLKWIFAPHEISPANIERLEARLKVKTARYSDAGKDLSEARVLIIDNIGILSSAYRYGSLAVIGGGFGKGIHNILEAACWGIPVLFGPNHSRFREALDLLDRKAAFCFRDYGEFKALLEALLHDNKLLESASRAAENYIRSNIGATGKIIELTFENRY